MTGLMEIPTARVMRENSYRFGTSQIYPYRYYYGTIGLLKGLELNGKVTQIIGVKTLSGGYGDYKDKSLDLKYQFHQEGKYSPALALGIMDPQGNRLYAGQYLVASKQIYPFDFTLGFGNGRFGRRPTVPTDNAAFTAEILNHPRQWAKDAQPFWGIQFAPSSTFALMMEYNPIKYDQQTQDPAQAKYFTRPVGLHYNFGARWKPFSWTELDLTYQRGNQIGVNASFAFDIGNPLIRIYDKPYKEKARDTVKDFDERMIMALKAQGFNDIGVRQDGNTLLIRAQNSKYLYSMRAVGVILKTVSVFRSPSVEHIRIILTQNGIPAFEIVTRKADVDDLYANRLTKEEFFYLSTINTELRDAPEIPTKGKQLFSSGWRPSFQTELQQAEQFFQYRLGAEGWIAYHPWKGGSVVGSLEAYPLNTIKPTVIPPSEAVRSDVFAYRNKDLNLGRLMLDQVYKPTGSLYTRFGAGFLEIEYAGLDGEIAAPLRSGRFLVGLQASVLKKRDPDNPFQLKEHDVKSYYHTEFLNTRLNLPEVNMALDFKTGRFLGGDFGTRITVEKFVKGVTLYAWYSFTDTSVFQDPYNRGYHDKGIGVRIPLRLFEGTDSKTAFNYGISPWTRDVAQDISRYNTLFNYIGRNEKILLDNDRQQFR